MAEIELHREMVADGEKAKWPFETGYSNPTKDGYLFHGWEYDGTIYEPPYQESSNPFGPITENTDIKAKWDKLTIHADANHYLISGDGDTDDDLTKLMYWVSSDMGHMITSGVEIEDVQLDSGMLPIVFDGDGSTAVVDNKNVKTVKVKENDKNISRYYRFKSKYADSSLESDVIEIQQIGKDQTILPDFDFLTFTYTWENDDGRDLDTATFVMGTNIPIGDDGKKLEDYPVGFGCRGSKNIDPDYAEDGTSSNPELFNEVSKFLKGGGDNMNSGKESALINWKEICNRDFITQGITKLYCELYANWYGVRKRGNCTVSFSTYKTESGNGGMQLDRDSAGKSLYTFSTTGDTVLKNKMSISGNAYASSFVNESQRYYSPTGDERGYYSHIATLIYDVKTKSAVLENKMESETGRNLRFYCKVNGEESNIDGSIYGIFEDYHEYNDLFVKKFTFEEMTLYINGEPKTVTIEYTDEDIKNLMRFYVTTERWVEFVSAERDSSNHLTSVTFKAISPYMGTQSYREMDVQFMTSQVDTIICGVRLQLYQRANS